MDLSTFTADEVAESFMRDCGVRSSMFFVVKDKGGRFRILLDSDPL